MQELEYPFSAENILRKKKLYKKELLNSNKNYIEKNIAILGGSTTRDIKDCLELFLLNQGIKANFYESDYNKYYEESVFENDTLKKFKPDIIYIFTTYKNINITPSLTDTEESINDKIKNEYMRFVNIWSSLKEKYNPIIIQNNMEMPNYRLLGNKEASSPNGLINYIQKINNKFYEYANKNNNFYIVDINYLSATFGLDKWHDEQTYALYKYAMNINAIPSISFNVSNIIKSIYGKNKKAIAIDLDNTLWGGVIGDDGVNNIKVGPEGEVDEMYLAFQKYIKKLKELGIILNIVSKNDADIALEGIEKSDGALKKEDFLYIKTNFDNKDKNIIDIAKEMNIGLDSFVFIDDNPAERELVKSNIKDIAVPSIDDINEYIKTIDRSGYFENTIFSKEDLNKISMYKENSLRMEEEKKFKDYGDYLDALDMNAKLHDFDIENIKRITQLINKSNQFNLTTKRYQENEIEDIINNKNYITIYGKLSDKFGDNGIVSLVIGRIDDKDKSILHMDLWVMSCRVLKRDLENAMMDELINQCKTKNIKKIIGYYYKTQKNNMVSNFYENMGFEIIESFDDKKIYEYIVDNYKINKNTHIKINN